MVTAGARCEHGIITGGRQFKTTAFDNNFIIVYYYCYYYCFQVVFLAFVLNQLPFGGFCLYLDANALTNDPVGVGGLRLYSRGPLYKWCLHSELRGQSHTAGGIPHSHADVRVCVEHPFLVLEKLSA